MAEGFKIAAAYVEVHLQDNTEADERRIRQRLERSNAITIKTVLDDPQGLEKIKERVKRSSPAKMPVEAENPIDDAWRSKIKASLKATANDSLKIPITPQTELFRRRLSELMKEIQVGLKADIPANLSDAVQFKREVQLLAHLASEEVKVRIPVEVDKASVAKAEGELQSAAKQAQASFNWISFAALSLGLPAAAAIGAAGAVVALSAVPLAFTAWGAFALRSNEQVKSAFGDLRTNVVADTKTMASSLEGPLVGAAGDLQASFTRMKPEISAAFSGSGPAVKELTGSVTDLAEKTMPGLVAAINRSGGALKGFRSFTGDLGAGLSDMFISLASESDAAGHSMQVFGNISRDLLGFVGQLLANLSAGASGPLNQFRGTLLQVEDTLLTLTSSGMPLLTGVTSGFLGTVSGGLGIVQAMASALGSWAQPLGNFGGSMLATNSLAKLFGTSLSETGFGLKAFSTTIDEAGRKTTPFKTAMADAEKSGTSKLKAGVSSLAEGGLNPLGIALIAGGFLLDAWGQNAQKAAERAAEQKAAVSDLTQAYLADNGAIGDNVRSVTQKALSDKNAYQNGQIFGQGLVQVSEAALGNKDALDKFNTSAKDYIKQVLSGNDANRQMTPTMLENADAFAKLGGNGADLVQNLSAVRLHHLSLTEAEKNGLVAAYDAITAVNGEARAQDEAAKKAAALAAAQEKLASLVSRGLSPAMYAGKVATEALQAEFETLSRVGGDVAAKGKAIIDVMLQLAGTTPSVDEALQTWNDHMRLATDSFAKVKKESKDFPPNMISAAGAIDTASQAGSQLQDVLQQAATDLAAYGQSLKDSGQSATDITPKLATMREEFGKHLKTLGLNDETITKLLDHYGLIPSDIVTQLRLEGDKESQSQIANVIGQLKSVPEDKGVRIDALTDPAIKALGDLGNTVVKLPNGKFAVFADTAPGHAAAQKLIDEVGASDATVAVYANTAPANQSVIDWKHTTTETNGKTTTFTNTDPATGNVRQWKVTTDATGAKTTTYATTDPATGAVKVWKLNADGTWAEVHAKGDVSSAEASLNSAARTRYANIIGVYIPPSTTGKGASTFGLAKGGLSGYASGGQTKGLPGYASGSMVDATRGGFLEGPGTTTSDDILTLFSNGLGKTSDEEFVINAADTKRARPLLEFINAGGLRKYGDGGMVQAEDGSWVSTSFYGGAPKGPHAAYTESGFAVLRAAALANGIGSLLPSQQAQLRTYGGWVDQPASAVAAGTPLAVAAAGASRPGALVQQQPEAHTQTLSGRSVNFTININGAQQPGEVLAAQVANEVMWRLR